MKKRINLAKVTSFALLLTMIAVILVSGTYAKYTSTASGTNATVVAKWSFMANGKDMTTLENNEEIEFDLFNTIYDSNGTDKETDVEDGLIAPGTSGSFEFVLQNTSDVTTQYAIDFEVEDENDIPIQYSLNGNDWYSEISDIDIRKSDDTILAIGSGEKSITIKWKWAFDGDNDKDTQLGTLEDVTIKIKATVTATQINYLYSEKLEQQYELSYYTNAIQAIAVINNSSYDDETLTTSKEQANVALYMDENDVPNLVILKDVTLDTAIEPNTDMILDLGGKNLTFNSVNGINVTSGDVTIDGTMDGSKILLTNSTQKTTLAQVNNGSLTLNGGIYETSSNGVGTDADPNATILVRSTGTLNVVDAEIVTNDTNGGTLAGILVNDGGSAVISDSNIEVTSLNGLKSDGIRNYGTVTLTNTSVAGYANYTANAAGTDYATSSRGINNDGTMTLKNCEVYGTHSGVRSTGTLYIDEGKYEGYGHGGIYFAGANTTSYVKNAYIGMTEMRNGYDDGVAGTNKAGFYIGGASNIIVYMDNCELWGTWYPLVMRISSTEDNNSLYISNSTLKEGFEKYIRIGTGKNIKIFIGSGNNFNAAEHVYWDSNGEETNTDYSTQFPEY